MSRKSSEDVEHGDFTQDFRITGATYDDERQVIWLCKYFEPFNVVPVYDKDTRKKQWKNCEKYFGKYITCSFKEKTSRGVPRGKILGLEIKNDK